MELRILKPSFKYTAGQWLFIQIPEISHFQWHPVCISLLPRPPLISFQFTITSAPEDPYVSVHIRQVGDWTHALGERLGYGPSVVATMTKAAMKGVEKDDANHDGTRGVFVELNPSPRPLPQVRIDGPYGAPAEDVFDNEVAILVGAGIGVSSPSPPASPNVPL
jgi:NADPH oxidase